jgi:radical SAM protein with 4Fe4S-binding SPASM domain
MQKEKLLANAWIAAKALVTRRLTIENDCIPFKFNDVPMQKLLNLIRIGLSAYLRPSRAWGGPTHLQIEPSTLCNLKCTLCPVAEGLERPTGFMTLECFQQAIANIGETVFLIILWDWGEPFLNPAIFDMIAHAKKKGINILSSTNGHVFAQEKNSAKLIRSGLDEIIVAIDGTTQETYGRFRQNGNLKKALDGARNLVKQKRALNAATPLINLRFIVTKNNEHQIPHLKQLAKSLGVDVMSLKTLNPYGIYKENRATREAAYNTIVPVRKQYQRFKYRMQRTMRRRVRRNPKCNKLWDYTNIRWDGRVCPCTYDYKGTYNFGNLKTDSFKDIWSGSSYRKLRRQFREDSQQISICENCTYAFEGGSCDGETMIEVYYSPSSAYLFDAPEHPEKVKPL